MTLDRAAIMTKAWVIVRRFKGNGETLHAKLSRALKSVWWDVKQAARVAAALALSSAQRDACTRSASEVRSAIHVLECKDRLIGSDWRHLDDLRGELRAAAA
jgi:hypothetical protein